MYEQASYQVSYQAQSQTVKETLQAFALLPARALALLVSLGMICHTGFASMSLTSSFFLVAFCFFQSNAGGQFCLATFSRLFFPFLIPHELRKFGMSHFAHFSPFRFDPPHRSSLLLTV